ncbi:MAG: hypothetical protein V1733_01480 [bacterium]
MKGIDYGNEALKLSNQLGYTFGAGISNLSLAYNYFHLSKIPRAIEHAVEAEQIFQKLNDTVRLCAANLLLCAAYGRADRQKANEYYVTGKSLYQTGSNEMWQLLNLSWLENLSHNHEPDSTYQFFQEIRELASSSKSMYYMAMMYKIMAENYDRQDLLDSANFCYKRKMPLLIEL